MRTSRFRSAGSVSAVTVALMMFMGGCSNDAPTADSSNRGSGTDTEDTSVENAFIVPAYVPGSCAMQVDAGGVMRFTVTNNRPADTERLLGLTVSAAEASIPVRADIPPKSTVGFGEPNVGDARNPAVRLEQLDPDLRPAMSADVTFHFERSGDLTMPVPVEACPVQAP